MARHDATPLLRKQKRSESARDRRTLLRVKHPPIDARHAPSPDSSHSSGKSSTVPGRPTAARWRE